MTKREKFAENVRVPAVVVWVIMQMVMLIATWTSVGMVGYVRIVWQFGNKCLYSLVSSLFLLEVWKFIH
jgi:hypothetical protein